MSNGYIFESSLLHRLVHRAATATALALIVFWVFNLINGVLGTSAGGPVAQLGASCRLLVLIVWPFGIYSFVGFFMLQRNSNKDSPKLLNSAIRPKFQSFILVATIVIVPLSVYFGSSKGGIIEKRDGVFVEVSHGKIIREVSSQDAETNFWFTNVTLAGVLLLFTSMGVGLASVSIERERQKMHDGEGNPKQRYDYD